MFDYSRKPVKWQVGNFSIIIMEIKGKIIAVLKENSGKSANGTWKNQQFVLETEDEHPKKFLFEVWGDRINEFAIKDGESLTVCYDTEAHEHNGKWYGSNRAWSVKR